MAKWKKIMRISLITFLTLQTGNLAVHAIANEIANLLEEQGWIHYSK